MHSGITLQCVNMPLCVSMLRCRSRPASNPVLPLEVLCALVHFPIHIPGQQVMHSTGHGWLHNRSLLEPLPTKPSSRNMSHHTSDTCDNHTGANFSHFSPCAASHHRSENTSCDFPHHLHTCNQSRREPPLTYHAN